MLHVVACGIDRYRDPEIRNLGFARADAEAFTKLARDRIHPAELRLKLLLDEDATRRNLSVAIGEELPRVAAAGDLIVLYFAGHGSPETESSPDALSRYFVPHDAEYANLYATGIDVERDLTRWFERLTEPGLVLLFMDACFSGRAGGRTFEGPHLRQQRAASRGREFLSLAGLDLGEGRIMMAACDDDQVAGEERVLGHGIFTHYLLQALTSPAANQDTISVHSLYDEVARSVRLHTGGRQTPIINGRSSFAHLPRLT
jgi:uncharacterized caspase-like protein